ncbi:MAG: response regulator transcription factor [Lachnospiraceae bacterium]|jgi:two-component system LytT family response regulator|nr:response regulator transcription factor [Lachnospiraceae bacterium]
MEPLQAAVCENDQNEQEKLLAILQKSELPVEASVYCCGEDFLRDYQRGRFDLVFMDIYMDGLNGVDVVAKLREAEDPVPVAFVTTSTEHALEGYRLDVLKYIEKPLKEHAVRELLQLAHLKKEHMPRLLLKKNGRELSLPFERILYAEQKDHRLYLYLTGGETIQINERLDAVEPQFAGQPFFRCHKSYLVNLSYVEELDRELMMFVMKEGHSVYIRRESMSKARKAFEAYLFAAARRSGDE